MLVSTKGRYALRTMVDLAVHGDGEPVKIKDIANRQGISGKYLEQIISILSRAGYVRSIRGNQGGYYLSKPAAEYTVGMILRVTEGSLAPVDCLSESSVPVLLVLLYTLGHGADRIHIQAGIRLIQDRQAGL